MASIADIPAEFLDPSTKLAFIAWINSIPTTPEARKHLFRMWLKRTRSEATNADWGLIKTE